MRLTVSSFSTAANGGGDGDVGLEEAPQEMAVGGEVDEHAAADDVAAAEHVEPVLTAVGITEHRAARLDLPGAVTIAAERNSCGGQPGAEAKRYFRRLRDGGRTRPAGGRRQQAGHGDRAAIGQRDLA